MGKIFEDEFNNHHVHENLEKSYTLIKAELELNTISAEAKTVLQSILEIIELLKKSIPRMSPEDAARTGILNYVDYIHSPIREKSFKYYKAEKNIIDLIAVRDDIYEKLKTVLSIINGLENKNILESLKELFELVEGIEPVEIKEQPKDLDKELQAIVRKFDTEISEYLEEAKNEHDKIKKLHGIVAGEGFTGSYARIAKHEEDAANIWRGSSVALIGCIIAGALHASSLPIAEATNLFIGQIIKTFSIAAAFIYGAVFAIRQSNQHRKNANRARWLAVGVNAIEAFIKTLEEEDKKYARSKMIEVILNQQEGEAIKETTNRDEIMEKLERIVDFVKPRV